MTEISRTRAWCKIAALIVEGPHTPREISFYPADEQRFPGLPPGVDVVVDTAAALWWWADRLGVDTIEDPAERAGRWSQMARNAYDAPLWHGYQVTVKTFDASTLGQPASDMDAVRAIAEVA